MRATLWQEKSLVGEVVREVLRTIFSLAHIAFDVVDTQEDLLAAARRSRRAADRHILIIDCFVGEANDFDRCIPIVTQTSLTVYIVHPRETAVRDLEEIAGRALVWLPAGATLQDLADKLQVLRALAAAEATKPPRPALTNREREVAELVAEGHSNAEISVCLQITEDTVRTHVRTLMRKFDTPTRPKLMAAYRNAGL